MRAAMLGGVDVKLVDLRQWTQVDRLTVAILNMLNMCPANDTEPVSTKRRKKWSNTLRSADLAEVLKRYQ